MQLLVSSENIQISYLSNSLSHYLLLNSRTMNQTEKNKDRIHISYKSIRLVTPIFLSFLLAFLWGFFLLFFLIVFYLFLFFLFIRNVSLLLVEQCLNQEVISVVLLLLIFAGQVLVDAWSEVVGVTSESDVHHLKEPVHTADHSLWSCTLGILGWNATEHDNFVCKVSCHDEIVLNNEGTLLLRHDPALHDSSCQYTLF